MDRILESLVVLICLGISAILHEYAHGFVAYKLGDDTAYRAGRLTLNPLAHVDPFLTLILPVALFLMGMIPLILFKPVPVNHTNLNNPRKDSRIVALAGPLTNLGLVLAVSLIFRILPSAWKIEPVVKFAGYLVIINLILAGFNLIPIPPLDGSWVLSSYLSAKIQVWFNKVRTYLLVVFLFLIISGMFSVVWGPVIRFFQNLAVILLFA